jgi:hypothetical protein
MITEEMVQQMIDKAVEPLNKRIEELQEEVNLLGDIVGRDGNVIMGKQE